MNALVKGQIEQFLLANQLSTRDLRHYCHEVGQEIALIWGVDDVQKANKNTEHRALSDEEALLILGQVERGHDANHGISWEIITWHISNYFETERVL
jgi:hypothetical protein